MKLTCRCDAWIVSFVPVFYLIERYCQIRWLCNIQFYIEINILCDFLYLKKYLIFLYCIILFIKGQNLSHLEYILWLKIKKFSLLMNLANELSLVWNTFVIFWSQIILLNIFLKFLEYLKIALKIFRIINYHNRMTVFSCILISKSYLWDHLLFRNLFIVWISHLLVLFLQ